MKKSVILIIIVYIVWGKVYSQEISNFIVITFERERKLNKREKQKDVFYWISNIDSIQSKGYRMYPLYLSGYSVQDLKKCCNNDTINPFIITDQTNFNFTQNHIETVNTLKQLINNKRIKIQVITKKWGENFQETIKVYATAVKGGFHFCELQSFNYIDYKGIIYLPSSKCTQIDTFWKSLKARNVMYADYSYFYFINNTTGGSLDKIPYWRLPPK